MENQQETFDSQDPIVAERRNELCRMVLQYTRNNNPTSVAKASEYMLPHMKTMAEAMYIGAFINYVLTDGKTSFEVKGEDVANFISALINGAVNSRKEAEEAKAQPEEAQA